MMNLVSGGKAVGLALIFAMLGLGSCADSKSGSSGNLDCGPSPCAKLTASDGAADALLGTSVAASEDVIVVGAPRDTGNGLNSGAAYVYRRVGASWVQEQKLVVAGGNEGAEFGFSVAIDGDEKVIVVGAPSESVPTKAKSGAAYVYRFDEQTQIWAEEMKLVASDAKAQDFLGWSVAIDGSTIVLGAWGHDHAVRGNSSGAGYVYTSNGSSWTQVKILLPLFSFFPVRADDWLGWSAAIDGDVIVLGARGDDENGLESGSAYVYRRTGSTWDNGKRLLASDGAAEDFLGESVAVEGSVIVVGAGGDDVFGASSGSAYVYRQSGLNWVEEQTLLPSDPAPGDWFGRSVDIDSNVIVIGAARNDDNGPESGSAYVYRFSTSWSQDARLIPTDGAPGDLFGGSVSLSGDVMAVGARRHGAKGTDAGSAYAVGSL